MSTTINRGRQKLTRSGGGKPPQNVFAIVLGYDLKADPKLVKLKLLMPFIKDDGSVIGAGTEVEAYSRAIDPTKPVRKDDDGNELLPRTVDRMVKKVGAGDALLPESFVELDTVWADREGRLNFRSAHGVAPASALKPEEYTNPENGEKVTLKPKNMPFADVLYLVGKVRRPKPPATRARQSGTALMARSAKVVTPTGEGNHMPFIEKFVDAIIQKDFPVTPVIAIVARKTDDAAASVPQSRNAILVPFYNKKGDDDKYHRQTTADAIATLNAQLAAEPEEEGIDTMLSILSGKVPGYQVEAVPGMTTDLPPTMVANGKNRDISQGCRLFQGDAENPEVFGLGFVEGYVCLSRFPDSNDYSFKTFGSVARYPSAYFLADIKTPGMSEAHRVAVEDLAKANSDLAVAYIKKQKADTSANPENSSDRPASTDGQSPGAAPGDELPF